jgi:hypothetical protein
MYDLDFVIVTFKRPQFLLEFLKSFFKISHNYNFRIVILDVGDDEFKEYFKDIKMYLSSNQVINYFFPNNKYIFYKQYNCNGDYGLAFNDYIKNISNNSLNFTLFGDDDLLLDLKEFQYGCEELNGNEDYSICNITHYDEGTNKSFYLDKIMSGKDFIHKLILTFGTLPIQTIFKTKKTKKYNAIQFLRLRDEGLEDFFGCDIHYILMTAAAGKIRNIITKPVAKIGAQGNETRMTVQYPLTQWICYYIYSKYTLNKLVKMKIINKKIKRQFLLHWISSFFMCYSYYLHSEYSTRVADYNKVKSYLKKNIILYVIKEIIFNKFLINKKIIKQIIYEISITVLFSTKKLKDYLKKKFLN